MSTTTEGEVGKSAKDPNKSSNELLISDLGEVCLTKIRDFLSSVLFRPRPRPFSISFGVRFGDILRFLSMSDFSTGILYRIGNTSVQHKRIWLQLRSILPDMKWKSWYRYCNVALLTN